MAQRNAIFININHMVKINFHLAEFFLIYMTKMVLQRMRIVFALAHASVRRCHNPLKHNNFIKILPPPSRCADDHRLESASKRAWFPAAIVTLVVMSSGWACAQGTGRNDGRAIAASCAGCHGTNGISAGGMPSLAGRPREELAVLMQEFKSGKRNGTVMPKLAAGYTDAQIEQLSVWFAAQKPAQ